MSIASGVAEVGREITPDQPVDLFIAGEFRPSSDGRRFDVLDPSHGKKLVDVAEASEQDVAAAVEAAAATSEQWAKTEPGSRGRILLDIAAAIRDESDELARLETVDGGKPWSDSRYGDVPYAALLFEFHGGAADKIRGSTLNVVNSFHTYTLRVPYGVVGAITPWNFPLTEAIGKVAPALAAGNTVVLKPSELAPLSCLKLAAICKEAGLPDGVLNVVPGGPATGSALVSHPEIAKVSFTGSTAVGRDVMLNAGTRLKSVSLELGGKSPFVVFDDVNLEDAAHSALTGVFYHQGQCCTASTRLLVHRRVAAELTAAITRLAETLEVGDALDSRTRIGPLISQRQLTRTTDYVEGAVNEGASVLTGGRRVGRAGYFYEPTVITNLDHNSSAAQEEIFGPVLAIFEFDSEEEAIDLANSVSYGLAATVWTSDVGRALRMVDGLQAGTIWVNSVNQWSPSVPFAGWKGSGVGVEQGLEAVQETYSRIKSVWIAKEDLSDPWSQQ